MQIIFDAIKDNWALVLGLAIGLVVVFKFKGGNKVSVKGDNHTVAGGDMIVGEKNARNK